MIRTGGVGCFQGCTFIEEVTMLKARTFLWWTLAMCLLLPAGVIGQTSRGGISGTVEDKSGAVVPDATVEIEQRGTGLKLSVTTTNAGVFSFTDLPVGFYTVTVSHSRLQTQKITGFDVQVGRISSLTITMGVAQQAQ